MPSSATRSPSERFWDKVDKSGDCWLWTASVKVSGYGQFTVDGKPVYAHRFAVTLDGRDPEGMQVDHLCGVRLCVNPAHLEIVTQRENIMRSDPGAHNRNKTHCSKGHEFTPENTRIRTSNGWTERLCRTCGRDYQRARALELAELRKKVQELSAGR